jgi:hypothetical protein
MENNEGGKEMDTKEFGSILERFNEQLNKMDANSETLSSKVADLKDLREPSPKNDEKQQEPVGAINSFNFLLNRMNIINDQLGATTSHLDKFI